MSSNDAVNLLDKCLRGKTQREIDMIGYTSNSIDRASLEGYIQTLKWWFESGFILKYTNNVLTDASLFCNIDVLELWKKYHLDKGIELKIDKNLMDKLYKRREYPSKIRDADKALQWWFNSGLPIEHTIIPQEYIDSITK
jgi:hypothetical protein